MNYKRIFIPNALVFLTLVTKHRKHILIEHVDCLRNAFKLTKQKYPFKIVAIVVNPNHLHMIIQPMDIKNYPTIVGYLKTIFTQTAGLPYLVNKKGEANIWQRRYWAHIILNEMDLYKHLDYIHYNSVKHHGIAPKDWPYSSFRKFVKDGYYGLDWCNMPDTHHIKNMDLE